MQNQWNANLYPWTWLQAQKPGRRNDKVCVFPEGKHGSTRQLPCGARNIFTASRIARIDKWHSSSWNATKNWIFLPSSALQARRLEMCGILLASKKRPQASQWISSRDPRAARNFAFFLSVALANTDGYRSRAVNGTSSQHHAEFMFHSKFILASFFCTGETVYVRWSAIKFRRLIVLFAALDVRERCKWIRQVLNALALVSVRQLLSQWLSNYSICLNKSGQ